MSKALKHNNAPYIINLLFINKLNENTTPNLNNASAILKYEKKLILSKDIIAEV